jgi:hypothetical protein
MYTTFTMFFAERRNKMGTFRDIYVHMYVHSSETSFLNQISFLPPKGLPFHFAYIIVNKVIQTFMKTLFSSTSADSWRAKQNVFSAQWTLRVLTGAAVFIMEHVRRDLTYRLI